MQTVEAPEDPAVARRQSHGADSSRVSSLVWLVAGVAAMLVIFGARLVQEPRFLFWDDSQLGAFGQWYGLGSELLDGDLPILSPGAWQGGNYLAEGQWGIWNPLTWLVALSMHATNGATLAVTVVKLSFLVALCAGAFLLARSYGAAPWWAAIAGFTVTAGGQTVFMDAPSWVTGLQTIALFAFVWWALKRHLDEGSNPVLFFVFSYLLVTIGYVFAVLEIAALLLAFLVLALLARDMRRATRILVLGAFPALLAIFVYLPGILTAPVTQRSGSEILNDQFLNMDLGDLATTSMATGVTSIQGYWGDLPPVPLQYVTWLLPLLILVSSGWRRSLSTLRVPIVILVFTLALVIGPSVVGPLRYPARMMPYVVLAVAVIFAVVASRGWPRVLDRRRVAVTLLVIGIAGWLAWAAQPASWRIVLIGACVQVAALVVMYWRQWGRRDVRHAAAWLLVASMLVLVPQIWRYHSSPLGNFNVPSSISDMREVASDMADGIFVVGDVYSLQRDPRAYREALIANLWYATGKDVASVYTVLPYTTYAAQLCVDLRGWTCPDAFSALFDGERPLADDMSLNTVIVVKGSGLDDVRAPSGWSAEDREFTRTFERNNPLPRAGGIAHTDTGVAVSDVSFDATSVTFTVTAAPQEGGEVVFSRLAWPGYTATGAQLVRPDRGFLLTTSIDASAVGQRVTVRFLPPGWTIELLCAGLAGAVAIGYSIFAVVGRRRSIRVR